MFLKKLQIIFAKLYSYLFDLCHLTLFKLITDLII